MYKIATQIIDAYDDIFADHLKKIASKRPNTYLMTPEEKSRLGDDDYALCFLTKEAQKFNKFPVDSYDNIWLSNEFFPETYGKLTKEAAETAAFFIKKACERQGIRPHSVVEKVASPRDNNLCFEPLNSQSEKNALYKMDSNHATYIEEKTASQDLRHFAEIDRICGNYTHAQYVFATPEHVKVASEYFTEKHLKMPLDLRHKYAASLQLRAEELGMPALKGTVAKYASDSYGADLDSHLSIRKRVLDGTKYASEFSKIASMKATCTPSQYAQILHAFDKKAGLCQHYGGMVKDPYEAVFYTNPDHPSKDKFFSKKASKELSPEQIRKIVDEANPKIAEYFGKEIAEELKKDPVSIFNSLPNHEKEVISNIGDGLL
jgi:hypothetical protein